MLPNNNTFYSPNFSTYKRTQKNIKYLILHYTGMKSEAQAINRLTDYNSKVSCHYFIKKSGKIILMVPDEYIAWHAGKSKWKKINSLNKYSIGIEIHNGGHKYNYPNFTKKQILSVIKLCKNLKNKYKIKKQNILGHSDISYNRKNDPGEKFPWELLSKHQISIWHNLRKSKLLKMRKKNISKFEKNQFFNYLDKFGYKKQGKNSNKLLVIAFQRRFRNQLINGIIDLECLTISKKLHNM